MGTLRVYGDSFGVNLGCEWQYMNQLQQYLKLEQQKNYSIFGCSNEWIIKNLIYDLTYSQIQPDDFILIVTTSETRQWLIKHLPDIANFSGISDLNESLTTREQTAFKYYVTHLQNTDLDMQRHLSNSALLNNLTSAVETLGARCLILPGFFDPKFVFEESEWLNSYIYKNYKTVVGNLNNNVCFEEFENSSTAVKWYKNYKLPDIRANHMLRQNHDVLFKKIVDHLETGATIDLTTGFAKQLITANKMHQYWSYKEQTLDLESWAKRKKSNTEAFQIEEYLKRLTDLETSRDTLPLIRSKFH